MFSIFIDIPDLFFSEYALCPKSGTTERYGSAIARFTHCLVPLGAEFPPLSPPYQAKTIKSKDIVSYDRQHIYGIPLGYRVPQMCVQ